MIKPKYWAIGYRRMDDGINKIVEKIPHIRKSDADFDVKVRSKRMSLGCMWKCVMSDSKTEMPILSGLQSSGSGTSLLMRFTKVRILPAPNKIVDTNSKIK